MSQWGVLIFSVFMFASNIAAQQTEAEATINSLDLELTGHPLLQLGWNAIENPYQKLSTNDLHHQFSSITSKIPDDQAPSAQQKVQLIELVALLSDRNALLHTEAYEFASLITRQVVSTIGLRINVSFDASQSTMNGAFFKDLIQPSPASTAPRSSVVDLNIGLALGFFESAQDATPIALKKGDKYAVVRKFRRAADDVPSNPVLPIYAVSVSAEPERTAGITVTHPAEPIPITDNGRIINKDFSWEIQTDKSFHGGTVNLTAELLRFDTELNLRAGKASLREALDIPVARFALIKSPNELVKGLKSGIDVGKRLFGLIGTIPTVILAWVALRKPHKKKAQKRGATA